MSGYYAVFFVLLLLLNVCYQYLRQRFDLENVPSWPISVFIPAFPTKLGVLIFILTTFIFIIAVWHISRHTRILEAIFIAFLLALGTNLFHGFRTGYVIPIEGGKKDHSGQYILTANAIQQPWKFICDYEKNQPNFRSHSRTHPPGTTLLVYYLQRALGSPALISLTIALFSFAVSMGALYKILLRFQEPEQATFMAFLFGLLPSIQIYYLSSLDAVIASLMLLTLWCFLMKNQAVSILCTSISLFFLSQLTFAFVFLLPVFSGFSFKKSQYKLILISLIVVLSYVFIYYISTFNYFNSFKIASRLENPEGLMLFDNPISYFATRLEGILEILLFFTPACCLLLFYGMNLLKNRAADLYHHVIAAYLTLGAMLLIGTFRTGETARACMYFYPYLFLPATAYLASDRMTSRLKAGLASLLFAQTLLMQLVGIYFW